MEQKSRMFLYENISNRYWHRISLCCTSEKLNNSFSPIFILGILPIYELKLILEAISLTNSECGAKKNHRSRNAYIKPYNQIKSIINYLLLVLVFINKTKRTKQQIQTEKKEVSRQMLHRFVYAHKQILTTKAQPEWAGSLEFLAFVVLYHLFIFSILLSSSA